jgi:acetyl-CoA carboxylase beta subunit
LDENEGKREDQWFRENEKQLLETARIAREKRERERAALEAESEREARQQQHFMKCPKCGHDLVEEDLDGVSVDRCSFCEGVFFDAGELESIFTKRDAERKGFFRKLIKI